MQGGPRDIHQDGQKKKTAIKTEPRIKHRWKSEILLKQAKIVINELSKSIKGPAVFRVKLLFTNLLKIIDWFEKNVPEPVTLELITPLANIIKMEMMEVQVIINEAMIQCLTLIRTKQYCNAQDLNFMTNISIKIILRLKSLIKLLVESDILEVVLERILQKLAHRQLNWSIELSNLKSIQVELPYDICKGRSGQIRHQMEERNKVIKNAAINESIAKTIMKMEGACTDEILSPTQIDIPNHIKMNDMRGTTALYIDRLIKKQIVDQPEKIRTCMNKWQNNNEQKQRQIGTEKSKETRDSTMLMVSPFTLEPNLQ